MNTASRNKQQQQYRRLAAATLLLLCPTLAFAAGGDIPALTQAFQHLVDFLGGKLIKIAGVLAIAGVGYATMFAGNMNKKQALWTVVGIAMVVGGGQAMVFFGFGS